MDELATLSGECPRCAAAKTYEKRKYRGGTWGSCFERKEEACLSWSCRRVTPNKPSHRHWIGLRPHLGHRGSKREQPCLYMIDVKRRKSKMGFDNRYVERWEGAWGEGESEPLIRQGEMCCWNWSRMVFPESRSDRCGKHDCFWINQVVGDAVVGIFDGRAQVVVDGLIWCRT